MLNTRVYNTSFIDNLYKAESRRIFATLVRLIGDFDLAEDAMHDAFATAMQKWPSDGVPSNPRAWIISTARFKAIDQVRRRVKLNSFLPLLAIEAEACPDEFEAILDESLVDDRLRLIFTCCHPAISTEASLALTLREACGLTTESIAHAFLTSSTTISQRIVRAKSKIRTAGIPYVVPSAEDLPARLNSVLHVVYLLFNEGYSASDGQSLTKGDLSCEAIRLGKLLLELMPSAEVMGLLSLMLLNDSRRTARVSEIGDLVLLDQQDRSLWNKKQIEDGIALLEKALPLSDRGSYCIQAAISAVHAEAKTAYDTDWRQIVALYDVLLQMSPSPVISLNRAVAVAMLRGPQASLTLIDKLLGGGDLLDYHLAFSARAELCRRLGNLPEAKIAYQRALTLTQQLPERRFFERRLGELDL